MTLIVGIRCSDGVVMASDSAATMGTGSLFTIGQQYITKVHKLGEAILFGCTGAVGMGQLVCGALDSAWKGGKFKSVKAPQEAMRLVAQEIMGQLVPFLQSANLTRGLGLDASSSLCKSLVAMPVDRKACLFSFDFNGAPEQATVDLPFVAIGSGQQIADPFLAFIKRLLWKDKQPSLAEGRLAAAWTIEHVKQTNPGGVGGATQLATLTSDTDVAKAVRFYDANHIQEHLEQIASVEAAMVSQLLKSEMASEAPSPPKPPGGTP